jgi:alpha,alpha-trehalose phosphorylase
VLQSELVANEEMPAAGKDPRLAAILAVSAGQRGARIVRRESAPGVLVHKTRVSGLRIAAGMSHEITGPAKMATRTESYPDLGRPRSRPRWPPASSCTS